MPHSTQNKNESSNHFEALFDYATMGILTTDCSGKITTINSFALNEFGYTENELIGKKIEMLIPKPPQSRPVGADMNLFAIKKDGTELPVEISFSYYHNNGDKFVIAFISNISVRKKAEAEIKKLNEELESTVEQRTMELKQTMQQLEISRDQLEDVQFRQGNLL